MRTGTEEQWRNDNVDAEEHSIVREAMLDEGTFAVKDCALIAIATGKKAVTLREFLDRVLNTELSCIYQHFWGGLLQPSFEEREYNNEFASWVRHGLHDAVLAERLAVIAPTDFAELEDLRQHVVELVEERLDESEYLNWSRATRQFEFLRSQIVVFDTQRRLAEPPELAYVVPILSTSSIFYHFIDARRRTPDGLDDFRSWLSGWGDQYADLSERIANIDPYFLGLASLREQLAQTFREYFQGVSS